MRVLATLWWLLLSLGAWGQAPPPAPSASSAPPTEATASAPAPVASPTAKAESLTAPAAPTEAESPTAPASPTAAESPTTPASPTPDPAETPAPAASPSPAPVPDTTILEGDLRVRGESWDWFTPALPLEDDYTFGHARLRARLGYREPKSFEGMLELQGVQVVGLPDNAIGPAPIGQMGPGAIVYAHTGQTYFSSFGIRQAYLKMGDLDKVQFQIGRMDFASAVEVMPKDPTLSWLKRTRLKDRLIGTFDFSPFARSFDGLRIDADTGELHLTGFVAKPTQGGFEPHFSTELDRNLITDLSITFKNGTLLPGGEAQLFWVHADDERPVAQVDNRPPPLRGLISAEGGDHIDTVGGHFLHKLGENGDAVLWYAHQSGSWGQQDHRADAFSAELGYQFREAGWQPWIRGGYSYYSGDPNPNDGVHQTFVAPFPTIRLYALTPFYTESNLQDLFAQIMLKPGEQTTARIEFHNLRLAQAADLWYVGAGPTRRTTINGYAGRPSGGNTGLANLVDVGVEHQFDANHKLSAYFGHVFGGPVIQSSFPANPNGNFFFLEYNFKLP